jgi:predicted GH43/DUF377 family glycosyl hydrolase
MRKFTICLFAVTVIFTQAYGQTLWVKDLNNPVFLRGTNGQWDDELVANPYDGSTGTRIGYAHSSDGINWIKDTLNNPVLESGPTGAWDEVAVWQPCVIFDGTTYHMWYSGHNSLIRRIGYATSPDGITWTKYDVPTTTTPPYAESDPVLNLGAPGSWEDDWVDSPDVLLIDGVFHMWYSGNDDTDHDAYSRCGHATSPDGITWTKDSLNPVLKVGTAGSWDGIMSIQPSVLFDGNKYHMWYSGGTTFDWRIGYASSFDGRKWTKFDNPNTTAPPFAESDPVLDIGLPGSWESAYVGLCGVIFNVDSSGFKMWYTGGDGFAVGDIGYATSPINTKVINVPGDAPTIQAGIDLAGNGDTVLVQPGTYVENINFKGKKIKVGSLFLTTGDTSFIPQTVIDGSQPSDPDNGSVVYFISGEDPYSVLSGFKITGGTGTVILGGGNATQTHGGGIFLDNSSSPILSNLIVSGNVAESANGAGIRSWNNSNPRIENVSVIGNDGSGNADTNDGSGGISIANSSPILKNVKIVNNTGIMSGGMYCAINSNPVLINVTISGNNASGSAWWSDVAELVSSGSSNPVLVNSVVWNDSLTEILLRDNSAVTVAYSDIQNGLDGISTFDNDTIHWLDGNMKLDPMFVNPSIGDYRLQEESPCIDAGIQDTILLISGYHGIYIPPLPYLGIAPDMGAQEIDPTVIVKHTGSSINKYKLSQNYPNPFNPTTKIKYQVPSTSLVSLLVYNLLGEVVATLVNEEKPAGNYNVEFKASRLPSGIYFYRLQAGNFVETKKMLLIK